jgi:hypothetical protein
MKNNFPKMLSFSMNIFAKENEAFSQNIPECSIRQNRIIQTNEIIIRQRPDEPAIQLQ